MLYPVSRYDEPTEEFGFEGAPAGRVVETPFLTSGAQFREGRYELERVLGRGGMAAVWRARDRRLERPVAIKVLSDTLACDPGYLARFEREARVAARLAHPNLIRIYDYGAERGRPFLVMEYVDGGDLALRLATGRPPDPERLARELLDALRHIHGAGVLHRDVKAQNVLIGRDGAARLTDFGIAQPADATSLTQTGMVLGTARYLAPEALEGAAPSERSDLYALGVVLADVASARPGGRGLTRLIDSLRAKDPSARPESAAAALEELERPAPRRAEGLRRKLAVAGAAATLVLAGAMTTVIASGGGGSEPAGEGTSAQTSEAAPSAGEGAQNGEGETGAGAESAPDPEPGPAPARADGFELNDRGFALINDGQPREAVPILRQAVDALEGSGDIAYAYALFNLGQALRLSGQPDEAVPILEARLEIPDQRDTVRRELEAARLAADAG